MFAFPFDNSREKISVHPPTDLRMYSVYLEVCCAITSMDYEPVHYWAGNKIVDIIRVSSATKKNTKLA